MTASPVLDGSRLRRALLAVERDTAPRLSPDGRSIAFVRTDDNGPELWIRTGDGAERRLAAHHGEAIQDLRWTADGSTLLYRHAPRGRESWSLSGLRGAAFEPITIAARGSVTGYWPSGTDPDALAYSRRGPGSGRGDLYRADLGDPGGEHRRIAVNPGFHRWLVDGALRPRGGTRLAEDGSTTIVLGGDLDTGRDVLTVPVDAVPDLAVYGFSRDGDRLFLLTGGETGTRRLVAADSGDGTTSTVFEHPELDVGGYPIGNDGVWFDPVTGRPDVCAVMDQRLRYHGLTERARAAVARLAATDEHSAVIIDRSADDRTWLIVYVHDDGPIAYHSYDPVTGATEPLFVNRPDLAGHRLSRLEDFRFTADDGRELSGYAMRPRAGTAPFPTVVLVHGGPASRDYWRFHADAQYLASLGYLSLHVNYRGSKGSGGEFRMAGHGEWGGRMQRDLYDAVAHGVSAGLVDPGRVAFFGASYGGYASLLAACTRPDLVRCAVAISPPCDLVSFTQKPPPYWQPLAVLLRRQVLGDRGGRPLGEQALRRRSPLQSLDASCAPVLLAHGVRDPRVPVAEVDLFADRARDLGVPVRYLRFEDEGHHVRSNVNRRALFTEVEHFLEAHLGAR
ncbi:alpha/beta fold hydrolase [Actinomadura sp. DC4]|uniref:S9 family peptidase n=1 Tax=Actinomadura sp. DC4 TaxID=3055069 RepID=UPI0025B1D387|nr:alpha/beta fold hydrolase [Actinomadura sp. DC4]MDN3354454.1 alpha/beta fold hydrolase [Actinomadura sp. DC4]